MFPRPSEQRAVTLALQTAIASGYDTPMTEPKTRILVVDDDLRLRDLLQRYLSEQGFAVHTVSDAPGMDKHLGRERVDLLVPTTICPSLSTRASWSRGSTRCCGAVPHRSRRERPRSSPRRSASAT